MKTTIKNCKKDLLFIAICVNITRQNYAPVAQLDRVFGYEPKGRGFESLLARQLIASEHRLCSRFFIIFN